jgi:voltage-gated potassium channel Kch
MGDISQRDTLLHAGVEKAEVLICTVPDVLLKGINNERLVRMLRGMNPMAKIIATADVLSHANVLMEAGADYVSVARLREAPDLMQAVIAATEGLIVEKQDALKALLADRKEVLP